jgi:ectoine hydroxylase-related dioxygenase (phytanoyl-CoA dioxygenase family)
MTLTTEFPPIRVESLPKVQAFSIDSNIQDIIKAVKTTGGCIIRNAVSKDILQQVEKDIRPHLNSEITFEEEFFPKETKRIEAMVGKSPVAAEHIVNHPVYQAVCAEFLTSRNWYWSGNKKVDTVSDPQLNNSICFSIAPGAWAQPLHRDSWCHHTYEEEVAVYPDNYNRDVGIGWFVAGKPATTMNGATRFIPGSHLWSKDRPPQEELTVQAELQPGVSTRGPATMISTI